jgi:amino acid adenylation domain-containing protein
MMVNQVRLPITVTPEELFSQKIYWLNKLSGEMLEANFIPDYVRPAVSTGTNQCINFELSKDLSQFMMQFAKNSYLSIYLLLLAGLNVLLYKYTGNQNLIVGSPIYKQNNSESSLNQVVPICSHINNQQNFSDFILQVRETVIDAYSSSDYHLEEILQLLNIPQSPNRHSVFDIVILLENIHRYDCLTNISNDLTFSFLITGDIIKGKVEYKNELFHDESIKLIIKSYITTLTNIAQNSEIKISDISCLTVVDKNELFQINDNIKYFPVKNSLHQLFEQQVKLTPNQMAVVCANDNLSYQELNEKANQLSRLLLKNGVQIGELVGIIKQRDINFLIALLAILKVGAVYVPIDSTYPQDRIRYMVSNSEVRFVLTDSSCECSDLVKCSQLTALIFLDSNPSNQALSAITDINIYEPSDFLKLPKENLEVITTGIDPAYMIYTSGSTGLPKGTVIRHGGAINHIYAQFDALELTNKFNFLQSAPASSDISVWQFLAPLLIGGKTVIIDTEIVCNPEKLLKVIQEEKITIVELVPIVLAGLLDYIHHLSEPERLLPSLKWMMVTGEVAPVALVNRWLQLYPLVKVVNAYGPSEAADDITQLIIDKPLPQNQRTVPIGKPLANLNLYILDSQMQLLPIGFPGEICVSGFGVGLGYWKNEQKTNSSFVPNPFPSTAKPLPGTKTDLIYKTGDLGRWLPDGNMEFLGRIDNQVKIRGFRIELGEIEALINQHPAVQEIVVVVREDEPGDKRLVAYVVLYDGISSEQVLELRQFLKGKLPEYMIPTDVVSIASLPLTPNGKVDRQALPVLDTSKNNLKVSFVPPRTPTEVLVADIWTQILKVQQVGVNDDFFDLGGHSLLATQVISRLREELQLELPLRSLFEEPTVARLVEYIGKIRLLQKLQNPSIDMAGDREEIEV